MKFWEALITSAFTGEITPEPSQCTRLDLKSQEATPHFHPSLRRYLELTPTIPETPGSRMLKKPAIIIWIFYRCT
jgi:hypothetical protein